MLCDGYLNINQGLDKIVYFLLYVLGAFGPFVGAVISISNEEQPGSLAIFLRKIFDFKLGWKAYTVPILIFGLSSFIAWIIPEFYGLNRLKMLIPSFLVFFPCVLFMIILGGGQEEVGWRGYALPRLEKRYGIWKANLILGIIWAFWHLPLWFISGTNQVYMNFFGFILLSIGYSFIMAWIYKLSNNRPFAAIYSHGFANAFVSVFPTIDVSGAKSMDRYWIWVFITLVIGLFITVIRKKHNVKHAL